MNTPNLQRLFYSTYTSKLYEPGNIAKGVRTEKDDSKRKSNAALGSEWGCTPRHASKVRNGVKSVTCKPSCNCPVAQQAAAKAKAEVA